MYKDGFGNLILPDLFITSMSKNKGGHEIKTKMQQWLVEEGFKLIDKTDLNTAFKFVTKIPMGFHVIILQPMTKKDIIVFGGGIVFSEDDKKRLHMMENDKLLSLLWDIRLALLNRGMEFDPIELDMDAINVNMKLYVEGLNRPTFMEKFSHFNRTLVLLVWMLQRAFGEPEPMDRPTIEDPTEELSYIR